MVRRHISNDVKEMALSLSLQGIRDSEVRQLTGVSERSLKRLRSTHRKSAATSVKAVSPGSRMLTLAEVQFLCDCVEGQPDISLSELQTELRVGRAIEVSLKTVTQSLQQEGYTMKTVTRPALEKNKQDREAFRGLVDTQYRPEQLVFVDESHFNRLPSRRPYAWLKRLGGERACRFEFLLRGTKYSMLPAMSLDGFLHLEVLDRAITGDDFRQFVQGLLPHMNEWPLPKSVLVFDNALIHKVPGIREMVEERGARLLHLPAYSPDLNPINLAFSTIKSWLGTHCDGVDEAILSAAIELNNGTVQDVFWEAARSVTAEQAKEWYTDCGYILPD